MNGDSGTETHEEIADRLTEAYRDGEATAPPRERDDLSVADGYEIQRRFVERRREAEGRTVGYKIGFTSRAIRDEVGIDEPAFGRVLERTVVPERRVDADPLVSPRVEAEIAFLLDEDLQGPTTALDALRAIDAVLPVLEVVDSRVRDWDVTAPEAIADNALAARVVRGETLHSIEGTALDLEGVQVLVNGEEEASGIGSAVLGNPIRAVTWLGEALAKRGGKIVAGDLVLTGSITPLVAIEPGDTVTARYTTLGTVSARFE